MMTTVGKSALRLFIATHGASIADTIVVGLGDTAGESMVCEWIRFPVVSVGTDPDRSKVIFKSSADVGLIGEVREIGLLAGAGGISSDVVVSSFAVEQDAWTGSYSYTNTNSRLASGFLISANATASLVTNPIDASKFSDKDYVVLAGFSSGAGTANATFEFDNGATAKAAFTVKSGYNVINLLRSALTKTGSVDWRVLTKVTLNPTVNFTHDLLKFSYAKPLGETLIARTVLTTPVVTQTNLPLEIEYPLGVNFA